MRGAARGRGKVSERENIAAQRAGPHRDECLHRSCLHVRVERREDKDGADKVEREDGLAKLWCGGAEFVVEDGSGCREVVLEDVTMRWVVVGVTLGMRAGSAWEGEQRSETFLPG